MGKERNDFYGNTTILEGRIEKANADMEVDISMEHRLYRNILSAIEQTGHTPMLIEEANVKCSESTIDLSEPESKRTTPVIDLATGQDDVEDEHIGGA